MRPRSIWPIWEWESVTDVYSPWVSCGFLRDIFTTGLTCRWAVSHRSAYFVLVVSAPPIVSAQVLARPPKETLNMWVRSSTVFRACILYNICWLFGTGSLGLICVIIASRSIKVALRISTTLSHSLKLSNGYLIVEAMFSLVTGPHTSEWLTNI